MMKIKQDKNNEYKITSWMIRGREKRRIRFIKYLRDIIKLIRRNTMDLAHSNSNIIAA